MHYWRWKTYGSLEPPRVRPACSVDGCDRINDSHGFCAMHVRRWKLYGDPGTAERLHAEDGAGYLRPDGYIVDSARDHPLANRCGDVYRHRKVLYDAIGGGPHACHWCGKQCNWHAEARSERLTADHLDWDRQNNDPANLVPSCLPCNSKRYETRTDRGSSNPGAKLTEDQVLAIRAADGLHRDIALRFGVSPSLVSMIRKGTVWGWLESA
jgi:hypothetical protein